MECSNFEDKRVSIMIASDNCETDRCTIIVKKECNLDKYLDIVFASSHIKSLEIASNDSIPRKVIVSRKLDLENIHLRYIDLTSSQVWITSCLLCTYSTGTENIIVRGIGYLEGKCFIDIPFHSDSKVDLSIIASTILLYNETKCTYLDVTANVIHIKDCKFDGIYIHGKDVTVIGKDVTNLSIISIDNVTESIILDTPELRRLTIGRFESLEVRSKLERLRKLSIHDESFFSCSDLDSMPYLTSIASSRIDNSYYYNRVKSLKLTSLSDDLVSTPEEMDTLMYILRENKDLTKLSVLKEIPDDRNYIDLMSWWISQPSTKLFVCRINTKIQEIELDAYPTAKIILEHVEISKEYMEEEIRHNFTVKKKNKTLVQHCITRNG